MEKTVNFKQMMSLILLSAGVVVMVFAFQHMGYVQERNLGVITDSPISPTERLPKGSSIRYTKGVCWSIFIVGIAMAVVGSGMAIYYREDRD